MTRRRLVLIAASAVAVVAAGTVILALATRTPRPQPVPAYDERQAEQAVSRYRLAAVAHMSGMPQTTGLVRGTAPCAGGQVRLTYTYDVSADATGGGAAPEADLTALRAYWAGQRYRVIEDAGPGTDHHILVESPVDGFRLGLGVRAGRPLRLAISSSCLTPAAPRLPYVTPGELAGPVAAYRAYVTGKLTALDGQVGRLRAAIAAGDPARARAAWLTAQLTWEQVGAAYGSFADLGDAIGGLPADLPGGVADPHFTGLHRIEYGLWHGQAPAALLPVVDKLATDLRELRTQLPTITVDPADLPLRAHEILEDALRDHLSGLTDQGSGAGYAETEADLQGTGVVLQELAPLLDARRADLLPRARSQIVTLHQALLAAQRDGAWISPASAPARLRSRVQAALGALLETLAPVPDLLEMSTS